MKSFWKYMAVLMCLTPLAQANHICASSCSKDCITIVSEMKETVKAHDANCAPVTPATGCADGSVEDNFGSIIVGCSGKVTFPERNSLCATGWSACSASEWVAYSGGKAPKFNYWTNSNLKYSGNDGNCSVSLHSGYDCSSPDTPMRICAGKSDSLGNVCNWVSCGLESNSNQYFGGCNNNATAGTVCCKNARGE